MQENPYQAILGAIRTDAKEHQTEFWTMGTVVSHSPLQVNVRGIVLKGTDLKVNPQLLEWKASLKAESLQGELTGDPNVTVSAGKLQGTGTIGTILKPGDQVAMLAMGDGTYLVLCKAVAV